jgi:mannose-6-phosphate isomerase-like protein (cupin superfamily)
LTAGNGEPSTLLYFLLTPKEAVDQPVAAAPATVKELYRTTAPLPELKPGSYELNLTRVTFPPGMPSNPPHHRSGAALYYIVSGIGANTVDGKTVDRGPGSLIYEPYGLVHQWSNPGSEPLTFLAFNINPEGGELLPCASRATAGLVFRRGKARGLCRSHSRRRQQQPGRHRRPRRCRRAGRPRGQRLNADRLDGR